MKAFLALMIFGSGISAFANTVVHCEQTSSDEYGYHDIFVVEVNEKSQAVSIDEISWNDKENRKAGGGTLGYYGSKPLKAKAAGENLVYKFLTAEDPGDGDYPGSRLKVAVTIPKSFEGTGKAVSTSEDDSGTETFDLACKVQEAAQ